MDKLRRYLDLIARIKFRDSSPRQLNASVLNGRTFLASMFRMMYCQLIVLSHRKE